MEELLWLWVGQYEKEHPLPPSTQVAKRAAAEREQAAATEAQSAVYQLQVTKELKEYKRITRANGEQVQAILKAR